MPRFRTFLLLISGLLGGCQTITVEPVPPLAQPCRFLLTFDDGPSTDRYFNTTLEILTQLESNDVQPDIKALFFVQTRNQTGGGTMLGRAIMRHQHTIGHVLGLHSGTARGHIRHTKMLPEELAQSLRDGQDDLRAITGRDNMFIRPTFWGYNDQTRYLYATHNLKMLLTDVNNRDGIILHSIFGLRERVRSELLRMRRAIERDELPTSARYDSARHYTPRSQSRNCPADDGISAHPGRGSQGRRPAACRQTVLRQHHRHHRGCVAARNPAKAHTRTAQINEADSSTQTDQTRFVQLARDTTLAKQPGPNPNLPVTTLR